MSARPPTTPLIASNMSRSTVSVATAAGVDNMSKSRWDMLDELYEVFPSDADLVTSIVKAMSDQEFREIFEYLMRHHS